MIDADCAAHRAAEAWGLPPPRLLRTGMSSTFIAGEAVVRVSTAPAGIERAHVLAAAGVRVPAPLVDEPIVDGGLVVTCWERLHAVDAEADWEAVGRMIAHVHAIDPVALPDVLGRCDQFPWWQFDALLVGGTDRIDDAALAGLRRTIERHRGWEQWVDGVVCHGDVHPGNVVMTADGPYLLDWDTMCSGPPAWDHAMLLRLPRWGWPARWYEDFARGYGGSLADDPVAEALADLRLVAATLLRLRAAGDDPSAVPEAELRLAYWRGDPHPPTWTAA